VGFDWEKTEEVLAKVDEELVELRDAIARRQREGVEEELGDLLFSLVNLSRFLGVQAEEALRGTTAKFLKRFRYVEERLQGTGNSLETASLAEMDRLWEEAKQFC
jgi:uncharacterized protein YabN with tetrapyrrole methylase and pyrophosphatase domain